FGNERLVLDIPILPDVWLELVRLKGDRADLIITPNDGIPPGPTAVFIRNRLSPETQGAARIVYGRSTISAMLTLRELATVVLPLSNWWKTVVLRLARAYLDMSPEDERRRRPMEREPQADPPNWYRLRETYDWLAALPDSEDLATLAS